MDFNLFVMASCFGLGWYLCHLRNGKKEEKLRIEIRKHNEKK